MADTARTLSPQSDHATVRSVAELDDFELLELWVNGDRRAGDRLVKRYYLQITRFFMNAVGDQERRDLTQKTFAGLCQAIRRFKKNSSFRSFLFGIARNVLNEFLRERYRNGNFDPQLHTVEDIEQPSVSRLVSELVRREVAMKCLRELPVDTKQLLELYYWHDMTAAQLGQMLGIPTATVRTRVFHARRKLIDAIAQREPQLGDIDVEAQLDTLRRLMGFGPRRMDDPE